VTFVSSSGDAGAPGIYPAYSQNVLAVGGTALQLSGSGAILGETAWSGSGGGISADEPEPSYQRAVQSSGYRSIPDVAFDASAATGVSVYDSYDNTGGGPWITMWGTSLGAPSWAALIAVANQGRVAAGGTTLDGPTQTLPALYSVPSTDFHDIATGSNGAFSAGPGYDEVTGLGTPVANLLAPDLAYYGMSDRLVITAGPSASLTAGKPFGVTIGIDRPDGTLDLSATGTLTISLSNPGGGASLGGTLTATIDHGVATFAALSIDQAGTGDSLAVSGGAFGSATSTSFVVTPAAASQLEVAAQPLSGSAGGLFGLTVDAEDAFGNLVDGYAGIVTLSLAGGQGGASLGGTLSTAASGGIADFSGLSIDQAGTGYTIQATASGLATATTNAFNIRPATPAQLVINAGPPSSVTAGATFGLTLSVEDAYGNLETGFNGNVTVGLAGGPAGAVLGGQTTEPASGGVATFSGLKLTNAGSGYVLTGNGSGLVTATSSSVTVIPAAASQLAIAAARPPRTTAGVGFGLTVNVEDEFGNLVSGYGGEVTVALSGGPSSAGLRGTLAVPAIGGVASFSGLSINRAGSGFTIDAAAAGLATATTATFDVTPAAPAQLVVDGPASSVTAGAGFGLTVTVEDAYGNIESAYDGDVTLSLGGGPAGAALGGATIEPAVEGVATFSGLELTRAGAAYAIDVSSGSLPDAQTGSFHVTPAAPAQLEIMRQPPSAMAAGSSFGLSVEIEDAFGNLVPGSHADVSLALRGGPAGTSLGGKPTSAAVGGVATFDGLTLGRVGSPYQIEATSPGLASAKTADLSVTPAAPSRLVIALQPPPSVTAGSAFSLDFSVEDPFGNRVSGYDGTITVALAQGSAGSRLTGTLSASASEGGATFSGLTIDQAGGGFVLEVSASGVGTLATGAIQVVPAAPSQLVIVDQPPGQTVAGQGFGFTAALEDAFGNVATGFNGPVTASLANGAAGAALTGPISTNAVSGIATFGGLAVNQARAGYSIRVGSGGLASIASTPITVAPSTPSRLIVTTQPSGTVSSKRSFAVGVEAVDAYGNLATDFTGTVIASLAATSHRNALRGTLSIQAQGGQAIIADANVNRTGKSFAITLTSEGLTPAATSVFKVIRPTSPGGASVERGLSRVHHPGSARMMTHPTRINHERRLHRTPLGGE
jgi:hypothetical protein